MENCIKRPRLTNTIKTKETQEIVHLHAKPSQHMSVINRNHSKPFLDFYYVASLSPVIGSELIRAYASLLKQTQYRRLIYLFVRFLIHVIPTKDPSSEGNMQIKLSTRQSQQSAADISSRLLSDWFDHLMFGHNAKQLIAQIAEANKDGSGVCGATLTPGENAYFCLTCSDGDETCVQCTACFRDSDHRGHDVKISHSSGGICDCGNPEAWALEGCCSKHRGYDTAASAYDVLTPFIPEHDMDTFVFPVLSTIANTISTGFSPESNHPFAVMEDEFKALFASKSRQIPELPPTHHLTVLRWALGVLPKRTRPKLHQLGYTNDDLSTLYGCAQNVIDVVHDSDSFPLTLSACVPSTTHVELGQQTGVLTFDDIMSDEDKLQDDYADLLAAIPCVVLPTNNSSSDGDSTSPPPSDSVDTASNSLIPSNPHHGTTHYQPHPQYKPLYGIYIHSLTTSYKDNSLIASKLSDKTRSAFIYALKLRGYVCIAMSHDFNAIYEHYCKLSLHFKLRVSIVEIGSPNPNPLVLPSSTMPETIPEHLIKRATCTKSEYSEYQLSILKQQFERDQLLEKANKASQDGQDGSTSSTQTPTTDDGDSSRAKDNTNTDVTVLQPKINKPVPLLSTYLPSAANTPSFLKPLRETDFSHITPPESYNSPGLSIILEELRMVSLIQYVTKFGNTCHAFTQCISTAFSMPIMRVRNVCSEQFDKHFFCSYAHRRVLLAPDRALFIATISQNIALAHEQWGIYDVFGMDKYINRLRNKDDIELNGSQVDIRDKFQRLMLNNRHILDAYDSIDHASLHTNDVTDMADVPSTQSSSREISSVYDFVNPLTGQPFSPIQNVSNVLSTSSRFSHHDLSSLVSQHIDQSDSLVIPSDTANTPSRVALYRTHGSILPKITDAPIASLLSAPEMYPSILRPLPFHKYQRYLLPGEPYPPFHQWTEIIPPTSHQHTSWKIQGECAIYDCLQHLPIGDRNASLSTCLGPSTVIGGGDVSVVGGHITDGSSDISQKQLQEGRSRQSEITLPHHEPGYINFSNPYALLQGDERNDNIFSLLVQGNLAATTSINSALHQFTSIIFTDPLFKRTFLHAFIRHVSPQLGQKTPLNNLLHSHDIQVISEKSGIWLAHTQAEMTKTYPAELRRMLDLLAVPGKIGNDIDPSKYTTILFQTLHTYSHLLKNPLITLAILANPETCLGFVTLLTSIQRYSTTPREYTATSVSEDAMWVTGVNASFSVGHLLSPLIASLQSIWKDDTVINTITSWEEDIIRYDDYFDCYTLIHVVEWKRYHNIGTHDPIQHEFISTQCGCCCGTCSGDVRIDGYTPDKCSFYAHMEKTERTKEECDAFHHHHRSDHMKKLCHCEWRCRFNTLLSSPNALQSIISILQTRYALPTHDHSHPVITIEPNSVDFTLLPTHSIQQLLAQYPLKSIRSAMLLYIRQLHVKSLVLSNILNAHTHEADLYFAEGSKVKIPRYPQPKRPQKEAIMNSKMNVINTYTKAHPPPVLRMPRVQAIASDAQPKDSNREKNDQVENEDSNESTPSPTPTPPQQPEQDDGHQQLQDAWDQYLVDLMNTQYIASASLLPNSPSRPSYNTTIANYSTVSYPAKCRQDQNDAHTFYHAVIACFGIVAANLSSNIPIELLSFSIFQPNRDPTHFKTRESTKPSVLHFPSHEQQLCQHLIPLSSSPEQCLPPRRPIFICYSPKASSSFNVDYLRKFLTLFGSSVDVVAYNKAIVAEMYNRSGVWVINEGFNFTSRRLLFNNLIDPHHAVLQRYITSLGPDNFLASFISKFGLKTYIGLVPGLVKWKSLLPWLLVDKSTVSSLANDTPNPILTKMVPSDSPLHSKFYIFATPKEIVSQLAISAKTIPRDKLARMVEGVFFGLMNVFKFRSSTVALSPRDAVRVEILHSVALKPLPFSDIYDEFQHEHEVNQRVFRQLLREVAHSPQSASSSLTGGSYRVRPAFYGLLDYTYPRFYEKHGGGSLLNVYLEDLDSIYKQKSVTIQQQQADKGDGRRYPAIADYEEQLIHWNSQIMYPPLGPSLPIASSHYPMLQVLYSDVYWRYISIVLQDCFANTLYPPSNASYGYTFIHLTPEWGGVVTPPILQPQFTHKTEEFEKESQEILSQLRCQSDEDYDDDDKDAVAQMNTKIISGGEPLVSFNTVLRPRGGGKDFASVKGKIAVPLSVFESAGPVFENRTSAIVGHMLYCIHLSVGTLIQSTEIVTQSHHSVKEYLSSQRYRTLMAKHEQQGSLPSSSSSSSSSMGGSSGTGAAGDAPVCLIPLDPVHLALDKASRVTLPPLAHIDPTVSSSASTLAKHLASTVYGRVLSHINSVQYHGKDASFGADQTYLSPLEFIDHTVSPLQNTVIYFFPLASLVTLPYSHHPTSFTHPSHSIYGILRTLQLLLRDITQPTLPKLSKLDDALNAPEFKGNILDALIEVISNVNGEHSRYRAFARNIIASILILIRRVLFCQHSPSIESSVREIGVSGDMAGNGEPLSFKPFTELSHDQVTQFTQLVQSATSIGGGVYSTQEYDEMFNNGSSNSTDGEKNTEMGDDEQQKPLTKPRLQPSLSSTLMISDSIKTQFAPCLQQECTCQQLTCSLQRALLQKLWKPVIANDIELLLIAGIPPQYDESSETQSNVSSAATSAADHRARILARKKAIMEKMKQTQSSFLEVNQSLAAAVDASSPKPDIDEDTPSIPTPSEKGCLTPICVSCGLDSTPLASTSILVNNYKKLLYGLLLMQKHIIFYTSWYLSDIRYQLTHKKRCIAPRLPLRDSLFDVIEKAQKGEPFDINTTDDDDYDNDTLTQLLSSSLFHGGNDTHDNDELLTQFESTVCKYYTRDTISSLLELGFMKKKEEQTAKTIASSPLTLPPPQLLGNIELYHSDVQEHCEAVEEFLTSFSQTATAEKSAPDVPYILHLQQLYNQYVTAIHNIWPLLYNGVLTDAQREEIGLFVMCSSSTAHRNAQNSYKPAHRPYTYPFTMKHTDDIAEEARQLQEQNSTTIQTTFKERWFSLFMVRYLAQISGGGSTDETQSRRSSSRSRASQCSHQLSIPQLTNHNSDDDARRHRELEMRASRHQQAVNAQTQQSHEPTITIPSGIIESLMEAMRNDEHTPTDRESIERLLELLRTGNHQLTEQIEEESPSSDGDDSGSDTDTDRFDSIHNDDNEDNDNEDNDNDGSSTTTTEDSSRSFQSITSENVRETVIDGPDHRTHITYQLLTDEENSDPDDDNSDGSRISYTDIADLERTIGETASHPSGDGDDDDGDEDDDNEDDDEDSDLYYIEMFDPHPEMSSDEEIDDLDEDGIILVGPRYRTDRTDGGPFANVYAPAQGRSIFQRIRGGDDDDDDDDDIPQPPKNYDDETYDPIQNGLQSSSLLLLDNDPLHRYATRYAPRKLMSLIKEARLSSINLSSPSTPTLPTSPLSEQQLRNIASEFITWYSESIRPSYLNQYHVRTHPIDTELNTIQPSSHTAASTPTPLPPSPNQIYSSPTPIPASTATRILHNIFISQQYLTRVPLDNVIHTSALSRYFWLNAMRFDSTPTARSKLIISRLIHKLKHQWKNPNPAKYTNPVNYSEESMMSAGQNLSSDAFIKPFVYGNVTVENNPMVASDKLFDSHHAHVLPLTAGKKAWERYHHNSPEIIGQHANVGGFMNPVQQHSIVTVPKHGSSKTSTTTTTTTTTSSSSYKIWDVLTNTSTHHMSQEAIQNIAQVDYNGSIVDKRQAVPWMNSCGHAAHINCIRPTLANEFKLTSINYDSDPHVIHAVQQIAYDIWFADQWMGKEYLHTTTSSSLSSPRLSWLLKSNWDVAKCHIDTILSPVRDALRIPDDINSDEVCEKYNNVEQANTPPLKVLNAFIHDDYLRVTICPYKSELVERVGKIQGTMECPFCRRAVNNWIPFTSLKLSTTSSSSAALNMFYAVRTSSQDNKTPSISSTMPLISSPVLKRDIIHSLNTFISSPSQQQRAAVSLLHTAMSSIHQLQFNMVGETLAKQITHRLESYHAIAKNPTLIVYDKLLSAPRSAFSSVMVARAAALLQALPVPAGASDMVHIPTFDAYNGKYMSLSAQYGRDEWLTIANGIADSFTTPLTTPGASTSSSASTPSPREFPLTIFPKTMNVSPLLTDIAALIHLLAGTVLTIEHTVRDYSDEHYDSMALGQKIQKETVILHSEDDMDHGEGYDPSSIQLVSGLRGAHTILHQIPQRIIESMSPLVTVIQSLLMNSIRVNVNFVPSSSSPSSSASSSSTTSLGSSSPSPSPSSSFNVLSPPSTSSGVSSPPSTASGSSARSSGLHSTTMNTHRPQRLSVPPMNPLFHFTERSWLSLLTTVTGCAGDFSSLLSTKSEPTTCTPPLPLSIDLLQLATTATVSHIYPLTEDSDNVLFSSQHLTTIGDDTMGDSDDNNNGDNHTNPTRPFIDALLTAKAKNVQSAKEAEILWMNQSIFYLHTIQCLLPLLFSDYHSITIAKVIHTVNVIQAGIMDTVIDENVMDDCCAVCGYSAWVNINQDTHTVECAVCANFAKVVDSMISTSQQYSLFATKSPVDIVQSWFYAYFASQHGAEQTTTKATPSDSVNTALILSTSDEQAMVHDIYTSIDGRPKTSVIDLHANYKLIPEDLLGINQWVFNEYITRSVNYDDTKARSSLPPPPQCVLTPSQMLYIALVMTSLPLLRQLSVLHHIGRNANIHSVLDHRQPTTYPYSPFVVYDSAISTNHDDKSGETGGNSIDNITLKNQSSRIVTTEWCGHIEYTERVAHHIIQPDMMTVDVPMWTARLMEYRVLITGLQAEDVLISSPTLIPTITKNWLSSIDAYVGFVRKLQLIQQSDAAMLERLSRSNATALTYTATNGIIDDIMSHAMTLLRPSSLPMNLHLPSLPFTIVGQQHSALQRIILYNITKPATILRMLPTPTPIQPPSLIALPRDYTDLFISFAHELLISCPICHKNNTHPMLCLVCGELLMFSQSDGKVCCDAVNTYHDLKNITRAEIIARVQERLFSREQHDDHMSMSDGNHGDVDNGEQTTSSRPSSESLIPFGIEAHPALYPAPVHPLTRSLTTAVVDMDGLGQEAYDGNSHRTLTHPNANNAQSRYDWFTGRPGKRRYENTRALFEHVSVCHGGSCHAVGLFLRLHSADTISVTSDTIKVCPSPYLDQYGEAHITGRSDHGTKTLLFLDPSRYDQLRKLYFNLYMTMIQHIGSSRD